MASQPETISGLYKSFSLSFILSIIMALRGDNRNKTEMTNNNKTLQDQDNAMTSFSREHHAQSTPRAGGLNKGDELGPNSEIGSKLRALYSSIQDETIPDRFLDLLEKLDQAERKSASHSRN